MKVLESTISDLEGQLKMKEEEAKNVVDQWEQGYKQLQETNEDLNNSLEKAEAKLHTLQSELDETKGALSEKTADASQGIGVPDCDGESETGPVV